ncbi:MAG TPA: IS110 family transposase [Dehalococcoidia bacterium]
MLCTIPGVQRRTAEVVLAEIGTDMSRFPSERHLASWAGQCPGNDRSAGKRRSGKTRHGSKWLDSALTEAAMAATRTSDVYLAAQYQRLRPRRGHGRALGAPSNTRSSAPAGTCSQPASSTATPAATTSAAGTPNTPPAASSPNSNASDTASRWRPPLPDPAVISHQPPIPRLAVCGSDHGCRPAGERPG